MSWDLINQIWSPIVAITVGVTAIVGTLIYLFGFSEVIKKEIKRRHMEQKIAHMKGHFIVCGFGRVGQQVAKELTADNEDFVIIERDAAKLKLAKEKGWAYILGDVALDETLFNKAKIETAKGIIITVGVDADAIFIAISARALRPDIFIVARASTQESSDKLTKIGVNRVAMPYQIGGYHMATMALRPTVVDFLDLLIDHEQDALEMEEINITDDSPYVGKNPVDAGLSTNSVTIMSHQRDGKSTISPADDTILAAGDKLVIMGSREAIDKLMKKVDKVQPEPEVPPKDEEAKSETEKSLKPAPIKIVTDVKKPTKE